jgi:hypothetical protein
VSKYRFRVFDSKRDLHETYCDSDVFRFELKKSE